MRIIKELAYANLNCTPIPQLAFPKNHGAPAIVGQLAQHSGVACDITGYLAQPVFGVLFRSPRASLAIVSMPEATMNKNNRVPTWEN